MPQAPQGQENPSNYVHTSRVHHKVPSQWFKLITVPARQFELPLKKKARPVDLGSGEDRNLELDRCAEAAFRIFEGVSSEVRRFRSAHVRLPLVLL